MPSDSVHSGVVSRISDGPVSIYGLLDLCVLHRCVSALTGCIDMSYTMHPCSGPSDGIRMLAAKASHPEFPTCSVALATLPCLANGATVDLWGKQEPLSVSMYNVNYSQTRIGLAPSFRVIQFVDLPSTSHLPFGVPHVSYSGQPIVCSDVSMHSAYRM